MIPHQLKPETSSWLTFTWDASWRSGRCFWSGATTPSSSNTELGGMTALLMISDSSFPGVATELPIAAQKGAEQSPYLPRPESGWLLPEAVGNTCITPGTKSELCVIANPGQDGIRKFQQQSYADWKIPRSCPIILLSALHFVECSERSPMWLLSHYKRSFAQIRRLKSNPAPYKSLWGYANHSAGTTQLIRRLLPGDSKTTKRSLLGVEFTSLLQSLASGKHPLHCVDYPRTQGFAFWLHSPRC